MPSASTGWPTPFPAAKPRRRLACGINGRSPRGCGCTPASNVSTRSPDVEREATAASVGLEYLASARFKSTGRLEWRNDSSSDSWLSTAGFAQKLSRNWTMLARNYYQLTVPEGAPNQVQDRFSIGAAYRDTTTNRLNLLTRYEFRVEDTPGLSGAPGLSLGAATDRRVQMVSTHADVHPLRAWTFSGQHAAKFVDDRTEASAGRFGIHLVSGRVGFDLSQRWDLGALTSVMWGGDGGRRSAVGGEVGFQLQKNLWLSAGYNVTGFADPRSRVIELHHARSVRATPHEIR